ncbi:putative U-box domain-containing protein 4-like [Capsicum annuum]|nr:probable serine/threonine-protein kinase PBL7 [Capsicum annuum]KAF3615612.1 putative U-box domain-containing protein 4-like [Capsicum annuum]KAF3629631.1 putative U-box domain-containing protein 4-like [Capsicum annuum]
MGFLQTSFTNSVEPLDSSYPLKTQALATDTDQECGNKEIKIKSLIYRMVWDFGLACFIPTRRRRDAGEVDGEKEKGVGSLEHNKAWLLAESGACGTELINAEPHSVHSSFRFSFCSQVELESMNVNRCSSATVLMVNLDNGLTDPLSRELKWRKIQSLERSISPVTHSLIRFTYAEIASATRNFSKGRVLGRGALSYVFRGRVGFMRTTVAIKRLDREDKESPKAFCRELMIASSLHNPYIVPLVGFCIDPEEGFFLVYKFVSGGSLERYLHDKKKRGVKGGPALPLSTRYKVAVGIADSIGYLHYGTERCVVHRDIKPSNILLSSKKTPKLCDFGLATWTPAPSVPFLCKTVKGTFGYLAPEYFQHGKVSDKTDVYAFGVVLLELLTGRKPIEAKTGPGEENLVLWAKPLLQQGALEKFLDPRLEFPQKNLQQIARMCQAAAACIHSEESRRSNMDEIIAILRGTKVRSLTKKKSISSNNCVTECYPQVQRTKSEMNSHLALAMLGVPDFEDDDFYCR